MRFIMVVLAIVFGVLALTGIADYYTLKIVESELTKAGVTDETAIPDMSNVRVLYVTPDMGVEDEGSN